MEVRAGYKQTEVGVIPTDWNVEPVGQAYDICNNLRLPLSQTVREKMVGQYPYYGPTSIQGYINEYRIEGEYALIGEDGDHFLKWRERSMTLLVRGKFNVNNHAHLIRGINNLTVWFYYYFSNKDLSPHLTRQGAGRYKLTKGTLTHIPIALPPTLAEQEAIAEALSDADALIESLEQLIAKKRAIKQGAMQELLRPKEAWEQQSLSDIAEVEKGTQLHSSEISLAGHFAHLNGGISPSGYTHKSNTPANTIAISEGGNSCGYVQFMAEAFWCGGHCYAVTPKGVDNLFLYHILKAQQSMIMGIRVGSGLPNVQKTALRAFRLQLPIDLPEQTSIATILSDMDAEITTLEAKLHKARQLKQGMMQELLTGRTRLV